MVFSSPLFLFLFLPVVLTVYAVLPGMRSRNFWLLLVSLVFYAWGEVGFVLLLLASTMMNHLLGRWVERSEEPASRKFAVAVAIFVNIGLLVFFKYANLAVSTANVMRGWFGSPPVNPAHVPLPIGISFFTFHALSYVIDIYRRKWRAAGDPRDVALYIFFFPQLIAGPILRWSNIAPQLLQRTMSPGLFAEGVRRFIGGLAKKMLIANAVAVPADQIFALPANELSASVAWFGTLCYTLQIYFDFSGYSDMAVGLGKMFGFDFIENFQFPYISQSIREFWRRWHISLSSWFRDYLYIPLGGNRVSEPRTYLNLLIVFFLCGLWHGASWTFVAWGLYHGMFLVLERTRFGVAAENWPRPFRHAYAILVVMMGWVLFRADTFTGAGHFFVALSGFQHAPDAQPLARYAANQALWAIAGGIPFSAPLWSWIKLRGAQLLKATPAAGRPALQLFGMTLEIALMVAALLVSSAWLAGGTYNPFIYFRF
jgi:alginate O-acetyltransferase complex protein AlgI